VPFYQPLIALEYFERAIFGKDIATGSVVPGPGYLSKGTAKSTYREGNSTIQNEVLPPNSTYPPPPPSVHKIELMVKREEKQVLRYGRPSHARKRFKSGGKRL